ncbi:MAG: hypothetical protein AAF590_02000 [Pseudomonadota bacterium]
MTMVAGTIVAQNGILVNDTMANILEEVRALAPDLFARRAFEVRADGLRA